MQQQRNRTIDMRKYFVDHPDIPTKAALPIRWYSLGILVKDSEPAEGLTRCASGTLISYRGFKGILTAAHVAIEVKSAEKWGLIFGDKERPLIWEDQKPPIFFIPEIRKDYSTGDGSDLAVIQLSEPQKIRLSSVMSFCPLETYLHVANEILSLSDSMWVIAGFPFCEAKREPGVSGVSHFETIEVHAHKAYYCGLELPAKEVSGFDYVQARVADFEKDSLPPTFEGASGGGLWRVPLKFDTVKNEPIFCDPVLYGVAFYESEQWVENGKKQCSLKCHFRKSIYKELIKILDKAIPHH